MGMNRRKFLGWGLGATTATVAAPGLFAGQESLAVAQFEDALWEDQAKAIGLGMKAVGSPFSGKYSEGEPAVTGGRFYMYIKSGLPPK